MRIMSRNQAFERVDVKTEVSTQIGALIRPDAIIGSSSSGIPASVFTKSARHRIAFSSFTLSTLLTSCRWSNWCRHRGPRRT